jgi:hypothetical protein
MRRLSGLVIAACVLSCAPKQQGPAQQAFVAPQPAPPPMRAPICPRPDEAQAIDVSALISQLQVLTVSCHSLDAKYNAVIRQLHPLLARNERTLRSYFARAYGRRGQAEHDDYITTLANVQSDHDLKFGDQLCYYRRGIFDDVLPLSTPEQLSAYVRSHPIQRALSVSHCGATPVRYAAHRTTKRSRHVVRKRVVKKRVVKKKTSEKH